MRYIGIDPGKETGFAEYDSATRQLISVRTLDFWTVVRILEKANPAQYVIVIEDTSKMRFVYKANETESPRVNVNIGHKAGGTSRESELLIELCRDLGLQVKAIQPSRSKVQPDYFKFLAQQHGFTGRTSKHGRDAAMLVIGR